jgi:SAM-dependent methyltransferase
MHESSVIEMGRFAAQLPPVPLKIADVGSCEVTGGTYRHLFNRPGWKYEGLDLAAGGNVDIVLKEEFNWSNVPDESYDVVISGQTLEHVRLPWMFMAEIKRITKIGGKICIIAPYSWEYHAHPIDCWRIFPDGMKALFEYCGLTVMSVWMNPPNRDTIGVARRDK